MESDHYPAGQLGLQISELVPAEEPHAQRSRRPTCPHGRTGLGLHERPRILSASKRTDIPAFYLPWLLRQIELGWVDVPNPLFTQPILRLLQGYDERALPGRAGGPQRRAALDRVLARDDLPQDIDRQLARLFTHVSLRPEHVVAIVWWSKNYAVYLRNADRFARYERQFFHFTVNPRRDDLRWLEPDVPPLDEALRQFRALAERFGPQMVAWRYDPLVFWKEDGLPRSNWDPDFFEDMCRHLGPLGVTRCITSVADHYRKFQLRMRRHFPHRRLRHPEPEELAAITRAMVEVGRNHGIQLEACTESSLAGQPGFRAASCIDARLLDPRWRQRRSAPAPATDVQMAGREACGCHRHADLGDYAWQECGYACVYCYANPNHRSYRSAGREKGDA
jgi:hypothetical protein